jgi:ERCC4-type nuclease
MVNIIIDIRETTLYENCIRLNGDDKVKIIPRSLHLGDIVLEDDAGNTLVIYERKSLSDLVSSIKDGRYTEQSHRLIHSSGIHPHNISYIIEGMYSQFRNNADKQMCISAMTTLFYFKGFSVFRTCSCNETAELIMGMAKKIQKELAAGKIPRYSLTIESQPVNTLDVLAETVVESTDPTAATHGGNTLAVVENPAAKPYSEVVHKIKKNNITPENIGEIILCSIPGISSVSAIEIMKHYDSFAAFMEEIKSHPDKLNEIYLTTNGKRRKLAKNIIDNIKQFLTPRRME